MRYVSTRSGEASQSFDDILLSGLAGAGGLAMPDHWPQVSHEEIAGFAGKPYGDVALDLLSRFAGDSFSHNELRAAVTAAYDRFDGGLIAPLTELGDNRYLLELFHGPTLAFKDIAMQLLAQLFSRALARRGRHATILAATSGDTGSAAIAAFGGLANVEVFVMHPKDRISDIQRRQMTTADFANVHNIALEGSFDDAQAIVKTLFDDKPFAANTRLAAVNSINFSRIAAQIVYYFTAVAQLGAPPVFVVPTGNFGDVFAGEAARRMGLGIERLVIATNTNDILVRTLKNGVYAPGPAHHTLSPSMDIQVASNFERALFEASARDTEWLRQAMKIFTETRKLAVPQNVLRNLRARYEAYAIGDSETLAAISSVHSRTGRLIDPHTAVALAAAEKLETTSPVVIISTAHPGKFPKAVHKATGVTSALPDRLHHILSEPERFDVLPPKADRVRAYVEEVLAR
jgi:threonine synthase